MPTIYHLDEEIDGARGPFTNRLEDIASNGFDLTKPRLLLSSQIRAQKNQVRNLVSLIFCDVNPPAEDWYSNPDKRFIRVSNLLMTSILFTGDVRPPRYEWTHCLVSFIDVPPIAIPTGNIIYTPFASRGLSKVLDEDDKSVLPNLNVNVQMCWMHHLDVYLFMRDCVGISTTDNLHELP